MIQCKCGFSSILGLKITEYSQFIQHRELGRPSLARCNYSSIDEMLEVHRKYLLKHIIEKNGKCK